MSDDPRRSTGSKQPIDLPIRRAMPAPLLFAFVVASLIALVAAIVLLLKPTTLQTTPVEARRPAPAGGFSHPVGEIAPAPTPAEPPTLPPPCNAFAGTRLVMSGDGVLRIREGLERLCRLVGPGIGDELSVALDGLRTATIRFAQFEVSAVESTLEGDTIWLNLRFARSDTPIEEFLPPLIHDAYHLATAEQPLDAYRELEARRAELEACRHLIARGDWPRWCIDAETLTSMPIGETVRLLETAGYDAS